MANLFQPAINRLIDSKVAVVSGGKMSFYLTNTLTFAPVFLDQAGSIAATNPVVTDSSGNFPAVYLDPTTIYRIRFTNSAGVLLRPDIDPVAGTDPAILTAVAQATAAATAAGAAQVALAAQQVTLASYAAATAGAFPTAATGFVPQGLTQASVGAITPGTGGANGTFALAFSGGNFSVNPKGTFTVAGGVVTAVAITDPGLYIGGSVSVPASSFAASSGLTGAAVALTAKFLIPSGNFYWAQAASGLEIDHYQNSNGTAVADTGTGPLPTNAGLSTLVTPQVSALGTVITAMPPQTYADSFASFNTHGTGNYYYNGSGYTALSTWLTASSGSFTRASVGTYINSSGLMQTATANTPRITYDPVTLAPLGLLYESVAVANLFPWSNKGNAAGASGWNFSPTNITMTDNNATGADGTTSAFTIRETAATGAHQAFYYPLGSLAYVVPGTAYAIQFLFKPQGRTKFLMTPNPNIGLPDTTVDLGAMTASNGYTIKAWANGFYQIYRKFTGAGAGTDVVSFQFALLDATGAGSYTGDVLKGVDVDNVMLSAAASLTAPLPSMVYRPDATPVSVAAETLNTSNPAGTSKASFVFGDGTQQIVTAFSGSYNFPATLSGNVIRSFISADLSAVGTPVTSVAGKTGAVSLVQADIGGLTTADSPTFNSVTTSSKSMTLGVSVIKADTTYVWSATTSTGWVNTDRGVVIGRSQARPPTWSNSILIGPDAAAGTAIASGNVSTSVVIGDTAAASGLVISGSVCIGNEAGNGGNVSGSNIIGNVIKGGAYTRCDVVGQSALNLNAATDSVVLGNGAAIGSGTAGQVNRSVVIGSGAGANLGNGATTTGNIIIGYGITAPTSVTNNWISLGNAFTYLGVTSTLTLQTPAGGKAKLIVKGLAASTSYANDAAAASGGVAIDELYRNGSVVQVRVT